MPNQTTTYATPQPSDNVIMHSELDDEISLIDLWLVLVKHKKIIFLVTAALVALAIIAVLVTPQKYRYGTTVNIGSVVGIEGAPIVDSPENVLAKIQETYIPVVVSRHQQLHPDDKTAYNIQARIPKNSSMVVLESEAAEQQESTYLQLHQQVVDELSQDHHKLLDVSRRNIQASIAQLQHQLDGLQNPVLYNVKKQALEMELKKAQLELEELKDPRIYTVPRKELEQSIESASSRLKKLQNEESFIQGQHERLETQIDLLTKEIKELGDQISAALAQKSLAVDEVNDEAKAMTLLLLDNTVQQNRNRLSNLEQQLYIHIPERSSQLNNALDENRKDQEITRKEIDTLKAKLERLIVNHQREEDRQAMIIPQKELAIDGFTTTRELEIEELKISVKQLQDELLKLKETRALAPPMRLEAAGTGTLTLLALATILGGMLGIFAAFFREFLNNAHAAQMQANDDQQRETIDPVDTVSPDAAENSPVINVKPSGKVA